MMPATELAYKMATKETGTPSIGLDHPTVIPVNFKKSISRHDQERTASEPQDSEQDDSAE